MTNSGEAPAKMSTKRSFGFYIKVALTFFLLIAFALGISLYFVYYKMTSDAKFEQILMSRVSEAIKMDVKFEKLDVSFPGFTLNNVIIATDSPTLKLRSVIHKISLTPDFWAAFNGQLILDSLSISSATTVVESGEKQSPVPSSATEDGQGRLNLENVAFPFNNFSAESLAIEYLDRSNGKRHSMILKSASIERSILSSSLPFNLDMSSSAYGNLKLNGNIYWPISVVAEIAYAGIDEKELLVFVPEEYRSQVVLIKKPEVKAELNYKINGPLNISSFLLTAEPGLKVSGNANFSALSPLSGTATFNLAPLEAKIVMLAAGKFIPEKFGLKLDKGTVEAEISLGISAGALADLSFNVKPKGMVAHAKLLPDPITLEKGVIAYRENKLTLSGIKASVADSMVELSSGEAQISPLRLKGQIQASVNIDKIWQMAKSYLPEASHRIVPSGKGSFKGDISYKAEKISVNGELLSSSIGLSETSTSASASIDDIKLLFSDFGQASGKIEIVRANLKGAGGALAIEGTVKNSSDPGFDLAASGKVVLGEFSALAASIFKLPVEKDQFAGEIRLNLKLGGTLADLKPKGTLTLAGVRANLSSQGLLISNLNGLASADNDQLKIENLSAELLDGKLTLSGVLKDFKKPLVQAEASLVGADLGQVRTFIKKNFPQMPEEIDVSGKSNLTLTISGPISEPKIVGSADIKTAKFFHPAVLRPLESINGPIAFNNDGLSTQRLEAKWGTSAVDIKGGLKDWGRLVADFSYNVNPLDVTDAAGFFLKESGYSVNGTGMGSGKITGAIEKIKVDGVVQMPEGIFSSPISEGSKEEFKFPFTKLKASFSYFDKRFDVLAAEMEIFKGKINASGKVFIDKEPIKFDFDTKLAKIETSEFLKKNTKYGSALRGGLDGSAQIVGDASGLAAINGSAKLAMEEGAYNSPPVIQKICEQLNASHLASGTIQNVSGDYTIANGKISSKNTMAKSKDGKMIYTGYVALDATIDGTMEMEIKRESCQQSNLLKQLVGDEDFLSIPVSLKGSLTSPAVGIPLDKMLKDVAGKRVKKTIEKKATDALGKLFGIKNEDAPVQSASPSLSTPPVPEQKKEEQPPVKKIEKKIKDIGKDLKKIFKF